MRTIQRTSRFKSDFKREKKGQYRSILDTEFQDLVTALAIDQIIPARYRDHALIGDWSDHRDCHLRPNLILIYRKPDDESLQLVRLGSHAELGL